MIGGGSYIRREGSFFDGQKQSEDGLEVFDRKEIADLPKIWIAFWLFYTIFLGEQKEKQEKAFWVRINGIQTTCLKG